MKHVGILILAAGNSSRMGAIKLLLPWQGNTLLGHVIKQAETSNAVQIVVVLGANAKHIKDEVFTNRATFIENPQWEQGLGSTIAYGVNYLKTTLANIDGLMVILADQPLLDTNYLNEMMLQFGISNKGIVATFYDGKAGVPAIFNKTYFSELEQLRDDYGARALMVQHKNDIFKIEVKSNTDDIDTLEDYYRLKESGD